MVADYLQLIAYANSNGGFLDEATGLADAVAQCQPPIPYQHLAGGRVWIPRSSQLHADLGGTVYIETRAGIEALTDGDAIHQLAHMKQVGDFEHEPMRGATRRDLIGKQDWEMLGAITPTGVPTVLGVLLFSANPQLWFPFLAVQITRYPAKRKTVKETEGLTGLMRILDRSPLPELFNQTLHALRDIQKTPAEAIREVVLNAFLHREYRAHHPIQINVYSDGLEVITPGGLPGYVEGANIDQHRLWRNPYLVRYFADYLPRQGNEGGIPMIRALMKDYLPMQLDIESQRFGITLYNEPRLAEHQPNLNGLTPQQEQILQTIAECGSITERGLRTLFPKLAVSSLQLAIEDLVQRGLLTQITTKSNISYVKKMVE